MSIRIDFCDPHATGPDAQGADRAALRCFFDQPLYTLFATSPEQVPPLLTQVEAFSSQGLWCVGYLRYEAASAFDAALQTHAAEGPLAWFGVYATAQPWPADLAAVPDASDTGRLEWQSSLNRSDFDTHLARIQQAIGAGECYQVNYTAPWHSTLQGGASALFERLRRAQPLGYCAHIDTGNEQILSVSPELFFDWDGQNLLTRPMKGTAPRGHDAASDAALAAGLVASAKERAENVMIVDLLRNDMSRIAQLHSVMVTAMFRVQSLPTVHQMVSDVRAQTRAGTSLADVFGALFPCGSITGAPKVRAMQMINALEPQPRGVYCGAIGVVRPGGHATFSVAIRTVTIKGEQARCGIGSGITADALPDSEWQEWQHKQRFLTRAAAPFALLETMRLQHGHYRGLDLHLQRLARAATHFGYPLDTARVHDALQAAAVCDDVPKRVRLCLDAHGTPSVELYELNDTQTPVCIALAATPFEYFQSEFTRFKTTRREHYDAFAPTQNGVFDTLLFNPQAELTECTRGNIAVLLDGLWRTPALHCGLLAGVGRQQALAQGRVVEAVITRDDLHRAQALAFVNSLRGWLPAQLVDPTL